MTVCSLMMFEDQESWGVTVRSLMMFEEFWASRCALASCSETFGRHGALSHDV